MRSLKIEKTFNKDDVFVSSFKSRIYPNLLLWFEISLLTVKPKKVNFDNFLIFIH